ncbi:2-oxo-4-hydroxy-4-carboxy-5-ureidoimidazoline decarboxylase [Calidifontibacter sp. DB0510]|uniref:2-oxo-4-hydroxy-4-carboxy-5-ureidoimidazoline decarboxylase n=1 Tax=Metallococcus carri TaxID=1656884 RepID=A0A967B1F9_9MICO|nr:2-oxo-4-hydroxy-4-carboxy-5-ureidoimidazoline decarboxylase [Metallococcus carri]NHN57051.1 2-oxo-4-hydroxy-4-carboxy-5-ureidoimidazoline decarboxylase [Metallococcus carri]NOP39080.1 2-oxo-4-hydroxy-4-carboxy-5-ureidoimidazoline decarboxylase [Calidifontibacter sp. DB2511S]
MTLPFDTLPDGEVRARLAACLPVARWVDQVASGRPYGDRSALLAAAGGAAERLSDEELDQALAGHPRIGERATSPHHQAEHSAREQAGVDASDDGVTSALARGNAAYEQRFGRVFIIRAAGRTAPEILGELHRRLDSDDATERAETVAQLREIALLRLEGML